METIYILFAFVVAIIATLYNRRGFWWFIFAIILSPIIIGIALLLLGKYVEPTVTPTRGPK